MAYLLETQGRPSLSFSQVYNSRLAGQPKARGDHGAGGEKHPFHGFSPGEIERAREQSMKVDPRSTRMFMVYSGVGPQRISAVSCPYAPALSKRGAPSPSGS